MLDDLLDVLCCPVCAGGLARAGGTLRCGAGHSFDVARQGYVNLLSGNRRPGKADTAAMMQARADFLDTEHYAGLAGHLAQLAQSKSPRVVIDAGAGTGYYLAVVLDAVPDARGLGLDVSKYAARRCARCHPRATAAVCDTWRALPIRDAAAGLIVNVFAPRNAAEFHRVLAPDGSLIVVTPTRRHLVELTGAGTLLTVDARKDERLERGLADLFDLASRGDVDIDLSLPVGDVERLVRMGPSAWHVDDVDLGQWLGSLGDPVSVTASFTVADYSPR